MCELSSPEIHLPRETDCGIIGSAEPVYSRRRPCRHRCLELTVFGFPGVPGDGMPGKNVQRKLGTTRGSPRRSRTAKASRISRQAVKSRCAREWGGWGRLSDDGPGHYNPDPSEGPWDRWEYSTAWRCRNRVDRSDSERVNVEVRRAKTNRSSVSGCREQA